MREWERKKNKFWKELLKNKKFYPPNIWKNLEREFKPKDYKEEE